jgi:hypothetical protein
MTLLELLNLVEITVSKQRIYVLKHIMEQIMLLSTIVKTTL